MAETQRRTHNPWMSSEQSSRVEINGHDLSIMEPMITDIVETELGESQDQHDNSTTDSNLGIGERAFSAACAAVLSAVIVNPLDVVKVMINHVISTVSLLFNCGLKIFPCFFNVINRQGCKLRLPEYITHIR